MEEKYTNKVAICSSDSAEVIIEFFREEPVINPTDNSISAAVTSVSKLVMSVPSAQRFLKALEEALAKNTIE